MPFRERPGLLLLLRNLLLHESTLPDFLARMPVGDEESFREFSKVVVDVDLSKQVRTAEHREQNHARLADRDRLRPDACRAGW